MKSLVEYERSPKATRRQCGIEDGRTWLCSFRKYHKWLWYGDLVKKNLSLIGNIWLYTANKVRFT